MSGANRYVEKKIHPSIHPSIYLSTYLSICLDSFTAYKDGERVECSDEYSHDYKIVENESFDTSFYYYYY